MHTYTHTHTSAKLARMLCEKCLERIHAYTHTHTYIHAPQIARILIEKFVTQRQQGSIPLIVKK
jgi:hypothetical protein